MIVARFPADRSSILRLAVVWIAFIVIAAVLSLGLYYLPIAAWLSRSAPMAVAPSELAAALPVPASILTGKVIATPDGSTVLMNTGSVTYRVKLESIDAPEMQYGLWQLGQPFAQESRNALAKLTLNKTLTAQCYGVDEYARQVCTVLLPDGRSVNRIQLESGNVWAYTADDGIHLKDQLAQQLERQAREERRGLWAQNNPIPPWKWRTDCWGQGQCKQP